MTSVVPPIPEIPKAREPGREKSPELGRIVYTPEEERFEYRVVPLAANQPAVLEEELNRRGSQGWRLVTVIPQSAAGLYVFVRAK